MRKREQIAGVIGLLKRHYYGNIALLVVFLLLLLFRIVPLFADGAPVGPVGVTAERYAIMITLIAIPVTLKLFAYRLGKLPRPLEITTASKKYKKASLLRLYSISAVTLMHILLFGISRNMNFFWFAVVLFIIFLYCAPSYGELETLTEAPGEQIPEETENQHPAPKQPSEREHPGEGEALPGKEQLHPGKEQVLFGGEAAQSGKGKNKTERFNPEAGNNTASIQIITAENEPTK